MDVNKKSHRASRLRFSGESRVADSKIDKTCSWPEGLHEIHQFLPDLPRAVKRSSSVEDIQKYKDYFLLAQNNRGSQFTWTQYIRILREDLRDFDTHLLLKKLFLRSKISPAKSEASYYTTASECRAPKVRRMEDYKSCTKRSCMKTGCDTESASSADDVSNLSPTPQSSLLKKMCSEIKSLAYKTCKTVEKMSLSSPSKYCSKCLQSTVHTGSTEVHTKCCLSIMNHKKPITPTFCEKYPSTFVSFVLSILRPCQATSSRLLNSKHIGMLNSSNLLTKRPSGPQSQPRTPNGPGVYPIGRKSFAKNLRFTPPSVYRVKPLAKQGRKSMKSPREIRS